MMWLFAILIVLAMGGVALVASGRTGALPEEYDDRPDVASPPAGSAARTCAGSGSRWRSAATG